MGAPQSLLTIVLYMLAVPNCCGAEELRTVRWAREASRIVVIYVHPKVYGAVSVKSGSDDDRADIGGPFLPADINAITLEADPGNLRDFL